jgi:glycosyltransferase involved in cell wall biosynthesis
MPTAVKRLLKRKLKGYAHLAKDTVKVPATCLKRLLKRPAPAATIALGPSDLVVMLGDDWKFPDRSATIYRLKCEHGFRAAWMIYDLISVYFPQFFGPGFEQRFAKWIVDTLWTADLVFAISENTSADIKRYCLRGGIPCPPIEVIRLGENLPESGEARPPEALRMTENQPFALCVGTVEVRKNQLLLYHVWRKLIDQLGAASAPRLLVVGMRGWMGGNTLHLAETDPVTKEHIHFLPQCNDAELRWLYQRCLFTLYPSFYEGWGLPVAESLAFGKHCIASDRSSIPEIAGDLIAMHDPNSVEECLTRVMEALDPAFRLARERRIRQQYRRREWSECAAQMAAIMCRRFGMSARSASEGLAAA